MSVQNQTQSQSSFHSKNNPFEVFILPETLIKLNEYATAAQPNEIGGLARLEINGSDVFVIDVEMLPQTASMGTFDISHEEINKFTHRMIKEGRQAELSEWCSIVHSHPVGMSPQMSTVDVDAIKRLAAEEDAFSLIITASNDANSKRLLMHYCTNIRGNKFIVNDIPVGMAIPEWVEYDSETMFDFMLEMYKNQDINEAEKSLLKKNCEEFILNKIPAMFHNNRLNLRRRVEAEVKQFVKMRPAYSQSFKTGGLLQYVNATESMSSEDLMFIANNIDPTGNNRSVSRNTRKHAAKILRERAKKHSDPKRAAELNKAANGELPMLTAPPNDESYLDDDEIEVGDMVLLKAESIDTIFGQVSTEAEWIKLEEMTETAYPVSAIESGMYWVNGFALYHVDMIKVMSADESEAMEMIWPGGVYQ